MNMREDLSTLRQEGEALRMNGVRHLLASWPSVVRGGALLLWGGALTIGCTIMMARHTIPLPAPELSDDRIAQALSMHRERASSGWMMTHVLLSTCPCSQRITTHLLERGPGQGVEEHIVWIVEDAEVAERAWAGGFVERAGARGFHIHVVEHEQLRERYHIEAAPLLLIQDKNEKLFYSGGYTSRKQGLLIEDQEIFEGIRARHGPHEALPLFGCAASRELRETIDPTGWFSGW